MLSTALEHSHDGCEAAVDLYVQRILATRRSSNSSGQNGEDVAEIRAYAKRELEAKSGSKDVQS